MSEETLSRNETLEKLISILELEEEIFGFISNKLCESRDSEEAFEEWKTQREKMTIHLQDLTPKYSISQRIPKDELGIAIQAILSYLLKIQNTLAHVLIMLDMVRDEHFDEVYLDSLSTITSKVKQMLSSTKKLVRDMIENPDGARDTIEIIMRLEREIDEDNIVICRQISVAIGQRESDFICYIMRKIVRELEHVSDYLKESAEIIFGV